MGGDSVMSRIRQMLGAPSVAIVGASDDERKVGYRPVHYLTAYGFAGRVYPVNPRLHECCGLRCYPSLTALPERPDLVVIAVNARTVVDILEEAGSLGVPSAVVLSSGFAELGEEGRRLQDELARVAQEQRILMCGPNSVGIVHTPTNLVATFSEALTRGDVPAGSLGVISQSGAYGTVLLAEARARGLGLRTYVSTGNEAAFGMGAYLGALIDDPEIRVIGGYVEGISDAAAFAECMDAAFAAGKPVVLLKVGRSRQGGVAAASHTGALVGRDEVYEAAFRRLGVVRARTDAQFVDILEGFDTTGALPAGNRVAVVTMSGGAGVLLCDLLDDVGLEMAELSEATRQELHRILPPFASVSNPVDLTGQFVTNGDGLTDVLRIVVADDGVDLLVVYGGLAWKTDDHWYDAVRTVADRGACVLAVRPLADADTHERFRAIGVPVYASASAAVHVAQALVMWGTALARRTADQADDRTTDTSSGQDCPGAALAAAVSAHDDEEPPAWMRDLGATSGRLDEQRSKAVLAHAGLATANGGTARTPDEARSIAARLKGNVVLKIHVPGLLHKTEIGGVKLDVTQQAVADVFDELIDRATAHGFDPAQVGVRVEEMVTGGTEFIIGAMRADPFGTLVAVGLGGTAAELLRDVAFEIVPVSRTTATGMVSALRSAALLRGYRGAQALDEDALIETICRVSRLAQDLGGRLEELDCNPVLIRPVGQGAVVLDAALILGSRQEAKPWEMSCGR